VIQLEVLNSNQDLNRDNLFCFGLPAAVHISQLA